ISDHLRRERHDLHEPFLAQLATHRPEDAGGAGLALIRDEHRRILVEPDVGAVLPPRLLGGAHDHGLHHLALLDLTGGDGVLDRDHHDVAQTPVAPFTAAQHANHERAARARVVRDLEYRFLLDHVPPPAVSARARSLRPRATASSSRAAASLRSAPCRPASRPCRYGPRPAWSEPPACRRTRARTGGPATRSRSAASCRSPPPRCGLCDAPSCLLPLAQDGLDPRDLTTHRAELQRVRDRLGTAAERQAEALLHQERELLLELVGLELPQPLGLLPRHATAPPASRTST